jgi:PKD repeat protein
MKTISLIALLFVSLFLLIAGVAADTIQVQNVQVNIIGGTTPVNIVLDTAPAGIAGYDINISLSNSSVATITAVSFPSWAILNESTTLPASSVQLRMVDLYEQVNSGTPDVPFGTITLQGNAFGSTDVTVTIKNITSDNGESLTPVIQSGIFTVDSAGYSQPIIANHTSTHLSQIPLAAIKNAKANLHIAYGHTSHGSQIITGMDGLKTFTGAPYISSNYSWNNGGTGGALDLRDTPFSGASDLGQPDYTSWATATRTYLNAHSNVNVVMWSWCGQVSYASDADFANYMTQMNQLETDYPNVKFVYMTGHLDGSGESGTLNQRNEQIRAYARANNKILYDFADIESYDPDGLVNYMKLGANDNCDYTINSVSHNWATEWQTAHTEGVDWYDMNPLPQHTQALNGNQKAYAAWWLWARLGGWDGNTITVAPVADFSGTPLSGSAPLTVQFTDKSTGTPATWDWNFGDGSTSTSKNPMHTYTNSGSFTVALVVSNGEGSDSISYTDYITTTTSGSMKVGVVRNGNSWVLDASGNGVDGEGDLVYSFGKAGDTYVTGDWDGDGTTEIGIVRNGNSWVLDASGDGKYGAGDLVYSFGKAGDTYVTGDWDGDGTTEIGIVRNGNSWVLDASGDGKYGAGDLVYSFGKAGDTYVTGDWDGDGTTEIGIVRNGNSWVLDASGDGKYGAGDLVYSFGKAGDTYVTGDWDGDGTTEIGVVRNGNSWVLDASGDGKYGTGDLVYSFGKTGDIYITGKW